MDELYDEEEIDLLKLVSTNANDANQFIIFYGSNNELYAKNVSKIEELVIYKDIEIVKSNENNFIVGTGNIRGQLTTIINFDKWMGNTPLDEDKYELIIVAAYGGHRLGIVVKSVENIISIDSDTMSDNSSANSKSSFMAKAKLYSKERMITIFDSDMMLSDVYKDIEEDSDANINSLGFKIETKKTFLFADDSKFIRVMLEKLCQSMRLNYEIYHNGADLLASVRNKKASDIALIITDIEMPVMGGREFIEKVRVHHEFDDVNIIVHTNMSNDIMQNELISLGAQKIIGKVNMLALASAIKELAK
jgi:two-component system chemotaxis response regulator CheV